MKNLLAFTAFLAAGLFLGGRRARKAGPIEQICIEVKADTSQAVAALKELQAQTVKTVNVLSDFNLLEAALAVPYGRVTTGPARATGQTTRMVDAAIQTLFTTGEVAVRDHVDHRPTHKLLYEKVVARLHLEHPRDLFIFNDRLLKIMLAKPYKR
jgi:hypothetical protein